MLAVCDTLPPTIMEFSLWFKQRHAQCCWDFPSNSGNRYENTHQNGENTDFMKITWAQISHGDFRFIYQFHAGAVNWQSLPENIYKGIDIILKSIKLFSNETFLSLYHTFVYYLSHCTHVLCKALDMLTINLCLLCIDFYVWDAVSIFNHLPRMFLSTDFAFRITDWLFLFHLTFTLYNRY